MSIIDTLVTDRTAADLSELKSLLAIPFSQWTQEQKEQFQLAVSKGAYNASDLNRVNDACQYLASKFREYGYDVSVKLPTVEEVVVTPSRLPAGYTELAYIESTGTQYINTGFTPTSNSRIALDARFVSTPTANYALFGSRNGDGNEFWVYWRYSDNCYVIRYGTDGGGAYLAATVDPTDRNVVDMNKNVLTVGSVSVTNTKTAANAIYPAFLFAVNAAGAASFAASLKVYSCQIYDNDVLVRDFVPCIDPSGAVGLYDLVTASFYGNSGTGTFVAGAIPRELPSGYTQVDYIQSSGTQYFDTGFMPDSNTRIDITVSDWPTSETSTTLWGTQASSSDRYDLFIASAGVYRSYYGGSYVQFDSTVSCADKIKVVRDGVSIAIGDVVLSGTASTFSCTTSLFLMGHNTSGSVSKRASLKLYSCQIYDNGTLVRDYVPAVDASGTAGLYDLVTNAFYTNAGSGTFTVGEEISGGSTGTETTTRNYWKVGDIPQQHHMAEYLQNINNLRASLELASNTPDTPADMASLTIQEANDIEIIIFAMHTTLTRVFAAFLRSGQFTFWSGNRALPTGNTDRGRTWAELDAMGTAWANWQEATWYLLLYGNLQAEGVV